MIEPGVVGDEVDEKLHAARVELGPRSGDRFGEGGSLFHDRARWYIRPGTRFVLMGVRRSCAPAQMRRSAIATTLW